MYPLVKIVIRETSRIKSHLENRSGVYLITCACDSKMPSAHYGPEDKIFLHTPPHPHTVISGAPLA